MNRVLNCAHTDAFYDKFQLIPTTILKYYSTGSRWRNIFQHEVLTQKVALLEVDGFNSVKLINEGL